MANILTFIGWCLDKSFREVSSIKILFKIINQSSLFISFRYHKENEDKNKKFKDDIIHTKKALNESQEALKKLSEAKTVWEVVQKEDHKNQ